jgi:protein ImuB
MPFACIFVPDFPVEALLRAEPDLRSQAVAVLEGMPPLEKVSATNEDARRAGVYAGMTKLQAELCDGVTLRNRSGVQELAAHQALLDCAQSFSPRVEDVAPDTLLLDLSGLDKLFGSLPNIARQIYCSAKNMGLETSIAVASTLETALLAAHGFSGVTVIPKGKEAELLGGLPVEVLLSDEAESNQAEEFLEIFERWGVRKFRDLAALPEIALTERLGQTGLELQHKASGVGTRNLLPSDPPLMFEESAELEHPIVLLEPLAFVLNRMLEQLCARLQARALAAQELHLELTLESGFLNETLSNSPRDLQVFLRTIRLPVPLLDPKTFLKLLQLDLKANPPGAPIIKVQLRIEPAKPRPAQNGFFIPASPEPEKLELTLARINSIVGEGRAGSPLLLDTHRPQAFEIRHFIPSESTSRGDRPLSISATQRHTPQTGDPVTALRIFRPPIAVRVNYSQGKLSHIRSLKGRRISGDVLWSAGPWRSSGDWWECDEWMRDEWDIALQEQNGIVMYRLIHDLINGRWMLEGSYD